MDEIKTVDDLLRTKNLTPEELELLDDVIQEARERERKGAILAEQTKANLIRLSEGFNTIVERTTDISRSIQSLLDQMETLYIKSMPDTKFYRE
jgi:hypothetical protein